VLDINPITLEIYEAKDKEEMLHKMDQLFTEDVLEMFKKEFVSFHKGNFEVEVEGIGKTLRGREKYIQIKTSLLSGHKLLISLIDITDRKKMEEELHQQATTDPLTKIFNRRYFFDLAQQELERSQRYNRPLSIIIFDIDHFKKVNDTHGHAVGDEVLRQLSERCQKTLRENDILARYGGEEFIILLPETHQEQAKQMAERMRIECAETPLDVGLASIELTISLGVSSFAPTLPLDELLLRADKALYLAKEGGRNRVSVWETDE
jgi:diguanylate cyclase (GGDEF)-like protein